MNQNGDSTNGEATQDVYRGSFVNALNGINITNNRVTPIRDNSRVTSQITINQDINIRDLNVAINITHTNRSDLIITIKSPWGQIVTLSNRRGGTGDHFSNTLFDDSAALSISSLSSTGNGGGTYRPESSLSIFNGKNAKGIWTITVEDRATGNTGTLNSWKLNFLSDSTVSSTVANSDGGTVSTSLTNTKLAASVPPSTSVVVQPSVSAPNLNLNPCGCPACKGKPIGIPVTNAAGNKISVNTSNHQSQADVLFSGNSGMVNLFRL